MATAVVNQDVAIGDVIDEFGRTEAERTVVLLSKHAEFVNSLVEDNTRDTFDEAIGYCFERAIAEITRQRDSAKKQEAQRKDAKSLQLFNDMLAKTPSLAANRIALEATAKAIGAWTPKIEAVVNALSNR
jgi:hypothetical protein